MLIVRLLSAAGAVLILGACTYATPPAPYRPSIPEPPEGIAAEGRFLYQRDCAWCHGDDGGGTSRGPDVVSGTNGPAFTDFMLRSGRMPIDSPDQRIERRPPIYTRAQINDLVAYVETLGADGPAVPDVAPEHGDMNLGVELYLENCAACHSTTGIGGTLTQGQPDDLGGDVARRSGFIAPGLGPSDPVEIAEAMRVGPGTMPVFAEAAFSQHELDSIVAYVLYLQSPEDRGGADIGRIGPVAEGAVAWIVGLGALLALARWIGTTRAEEPADAQEQARAQAEGK